jgi:hypothetical protein
MVCAHCRGQNVMRDAWAVWDIDAQEWTLAGEPFDNAECEDCGGETKIEEEIADETVVGEP